MAEQQDGERLLEAHVRLGGYPDVVTEDDVFYAYPGRVLVARWNRIIAGVYLTTLGPLAHDPYGTLQARLYTERDDAHVRFVLRLAVLRIYDGMLRAVDP